MAGASQVIGALLIGVCLSWTSPAMADHGVIRGVAVNGSRDQLPMGGTAVILRARLQGQFVAIQETTTDSRGTFRFEGLPVDPEIQYIAGANQGEVHYPGPRLRLTSDNAQADVRIVVHESVAEPNPLVIRQHDILVQLRAGALEVTETLLIDNPSNVCYVGQSAAEADRVVTLRLSIPPDFERITFEKEFFDFIKKIKDKSRLHKALVSTKEELAKKNKLESVSYLTNIEKLLEN